jgi:reactive intermediate/imine deaminase
MKQLFALAAFSLAGAAGAAGPVEYFPAPPIGGQPAPFSSAVRLGDTLYLSGSIGIGPDGKLPDTIQGQTKQTMDNIGGVLKRAGLTYDDVYKCTAFLADMQDWPAFNSVYVTYFKPDRRPARSAFGANGLALGAKLELECQAYAGKK